MKKLLSNTLILLCVGAVPLAASEFEVLSAIGVREPEGLMAGQQLSENTSLVLEFWGRALIRETKKCGLTHVVVGQRQYELKLSKSCKKVADPVEVVQRLQRGEAFAEVLKQTGSGTADEIVQAITNEPCVFLPRLSEEGTGRRECPSGYALRGLRCSGLYCDDKDVLCCPYLQGAPDPTVADGKARWISEEAPAIFESEEFINTISCRGPYCDEIYPQPFTSSHLKNAGNCVWSAWSFEQPGHWLDCQLGRFIAGIRCQEDFCSDIKIYCCNAQVN